MTKYFLRMYKVTLVTCEVTSVRTLLHLCGAFKMLSMNCWGTIMSVSGRDRCQLLGCSWRNGDIKNFTEPSPTRSEPSWTKCVFQFCLVFFTCRVFSLNSLVANGWAGQTTGFSLNSSKPSDVYTIIKDAGHMFPRFVHIVSGRTAIPADSKAVIWCLPVVYDSVDRKEYACW